jgi:hypothetical protein
MNLSLPTFGQWLDEYFAAWQSNDPAAVAALFAEGATYYYGPFAAPARGRSRIVEQWVANPHQQVDVQCSYTPLAINGNVGVAHWRVTYRPATNTARCVEMDGVLVIEFDASMRCVEHREWYHQRERSNSEGAPTTNAEGYGWRVCEG